MDKYNELKLGKKIKFIVYKLNDRQNEIVVEREDSCEDSSSREDIHEKFITALPEDDCRYAVYDFEYDSGEGTRNKIFFVYWASDKARVKSKMVYSTSKDALRKSLVGIGAEVQATDYEEISFDTFLDKVGAKKK